MNRHIAILVHEHDLSDGITYLVRLLSDTWRQNGIRVSVLSDPLAPVEADLAILHVNLTVVPEAFMDWARRYPVVLNGNVRDISKRAISSALVKQTEDYDGPVIVKTNLNSGGYKEKRISREGSLTRRLSGLLENCRPWSYRSRLSSSNYRIFDSARQVPASAWRNPHLVVERFLPEMRDGFYCIRTWLFLGDRDRTAIFYSKEPVIKSHNIDHFERLDDVPEELRRVRKEMGFDYGKFDYVIHDGRPVLYDANRTPTVGTFTDDRLRSVIEDLAEGINCYWR